METTQKKALGNFLYDPADELGRGGFGTVWRGHHRDDPQFQVAIKLLHLNAGALQEQLQQAKEDFLRETRILCKLQHQGIVRLFDFSWNEGRPYLVMELAGDSLLKKLKAGPPLTVGQAIALTVRTGQALNVAHENNVVHRDLKPDNIMLRHGDLTPVITDFGIARLDELTRATSTSIGTPFYMAPEQFEGRTISGRTDLYALGILFHELLTGRVPYWSSNPYALAHMHLQLPLPQLPKALWPLQPVLDWMLAKDPDDRFPTAVAMVEALRQTYLNDAALRRLVGYAGSGQALSSQLRALGFELPPEAVADVRVGQGRSIKPVVPQDRVAEVPKAAVQENQRESSEPRPSGNATGTRAALEQRHQSTPGEVQRKTSYTYLGIALVLALVGTTATVVLTGQRADSPTAAAPDKALTGTTSEQAMQAQAWLEKGKAYLHGNGVAQSDTEAVRLFHLAAEQGDATAQYILGTSYARGYLVVKSDTEAVHFYRLAADQGDVRGQMALGYMYQSGLGVAQSDTEAVRFYRLAADQGDASGQYNLGFMYQVGTGVAQSDSEAARLFRLAADQGDVNALYELGGMYYVGRGVAQSYVEAARLFRLAADQGNATAQATLGLMYSVGRGVTQSDTEAARLFRLAADQGAANAQTTLGLMYESGRGVAKSDTEAVRFYRLAADQGDARGQYNLGFMYANGTGVAQSETEATRLFRLAADQGDEDARQALRKLAPK